MFNFFKKTLTEEQMKQMDKTIEKFKKNPHQFRFTVMFFISSIIFGLLSIFLLQQKFSLLMKEGKPEIREIVKEIFVTPPPKTSITPSPEATSEAEIIEETSWILEKSESCNVLIPISPYKASYEDNNTITRSWSSYSMTAGNDFPTPFLDIFNYVTINIFKSNEDTSENPRGMISIYCNNNVDKISDNDLKNKIISSAEEIGLSITETEEVEKWDKKSTKLLFSGGKFEGKIFYAFTTDKHLYLIGYENTHNDQPVIDDTLRSFNNLIFLD